MSKPITATEIINASAGESYGMGAMPSCMMLDYHVHLKFSDGINARIAMRRYFELTNDDAALDNLTEFEALLAKDSAGTPTTRI